MNIDSRVPVCIVGLVAHLLTLTDLGVVFTNDGDGGYDMRLSIKIMDKVDSSSFFSRLPKEFKDEISGLLIAIFGRDVAMTINRCELSIYSRGKALHGGGRTLQRLCLRLHRDGDLALAMCGPLCADACLWVRVRACGLRTCA